MKIRIYILTLISVFSLSFAFAQKGKIKAAQKQYDHLSYVKSTDALLKLVEEGNATASVIENLANAYYYNGQMEDAAKWYKELLFMGKEIELENYYKYAQALKGIGEYFESDKIMEKFIELNPEDSRAKAFVDSPNYLEVIQNSSNDFELENLNINTKYSDFGATFYNSGIYFASSREEKGMIYPWNQQPYLNIYSNNGSSEALKIQGDVNTKYHESSPVFTKDGKTMYFTRNNYYHGNFKKSDENIHGLKLFKAEWQDGKWVNIKSLPFNSDDYNVAHPCLSNDETKLYFASDMPGSIGASDIFVVSINEDGTFGIPENLGSKINTEGRENFPFISDKGTLYFSSDGIPGLGGLDVFGFNKIEDISNSNETVYNLGKPINSSKDDFGYIINEQIRKGYISSNREGGKGDDDIYSFTKKVCVQNVLGTVVNEYTNEIIADADVLIYNNEKAVIKTFKSDKDGKFSFELPCKDAKFSSLGKKETFKDGTQDFAINSKDNANVEIKLSLKPIPQVAAIGTDLFKLLNLNPIYFDYDKSNIRPDAEIELAKIINYMQEFPSVKVDVRSHTDSRGNDAYNAALSDRRNKSTIAYIIKEGGIDGSRITGKGYGETQLTNKCSNGVKCTDEEHQANRRSEFIVVAN